LVVAEVFARGSNISVVRWVVKAVSSVFVFLSQFLREAGGLHCRVWFWVELHVRSLSDTWCVDVDVRHGDKYSSERRTGTALWGIRAIYDTKT